MIESDLERITEDVYYEISGFLAEGTDSDDAEEIKQSIRDGISKAMSLNVVKGPSEMPSIIEKQRQIDAAKRQIFQAL